MCVFSDKICSRYVTLRTFRRLWSAKLCKADGIKPRSATPIYSRTITFSSEECTFSTPLYSISPSLRNLFMK